LKEKRDLWNAPTLKAGRCKECKIGLFVYDNQAVIVMQERIQLSRTLAALGSPDFKAVLKAEIEQLDAESLPLQQGLSQSSYACDEDIKVVVISVVETATVINVTAGVFYSGIIAGCSCADDPTPVDACPEYCEIRIDIDTQTANAIISLFESA